jgi:predicted GNAT family N-acyltransferase
LGHQPQPPRFTIEPLGARHDRAAFACGNAALDAYLHRQAAQDLKKRVAAPYVITPDGRTIAGYYTLSQFAVRLEAVPDELAKKLPRYPMVPSTLIGRLAVDGRFQGQRLGEQLLMDALHRSLRTSKELASAAVVVDAKDDAASAFYRRYGFIELPAVPRRFFLPIGTVARLFDRR